MDFSEIAERYKEANRSIEAERVDFEKACVEFVNTVKSFSQDKHLYASTESWKWSWVLGILHVSEGTFDIGGMRGKSLYFYEPEKGVDIFVPFGDVDNIKEILELDYLEYKKQHEFTRREMSQIRREELQKELDSLNLE